MPTAFESIPTVIVGGGQAGLALRLLPAASRRTVRHPRCRTAYRRRLAPSLGFVETLLLPQHSSLAGLADAVPSSFPPTTRWRITSEDVRAAVRASRAGVQRARYPRVAQRRRLRAWRPRMVLPQCDRGHRHGWLSAVPVVPTFADRSSGLKFGSCTPPRTKNPSQPGGEPCSSWAREIRVPRPPSSRPSGPATRRCSGRHPGQVPCPYRDPPGEAVGADRDVRIPAGAEPRHAAGDASSRQAIEHGTPLARKPSRATSKLPVCNGSAAIAGARDGLPITEDDQVLEPRTVVWRTGYRPDYSWIEPPVADEDGPPDHRARRLAWKPVCTSSVLSSSTRSRVVNHPGA